MARKLIHPKNKIKKEEKTEQISIKLLNISIVRREISILSSENFFIRLKLPKSA